MVDGLEICGILFLSLIGYVLIEYIYENLIKDLWRKFTKWLKN